MPLRGLTIIVAGPEPTRLRSALGLALSTAALDARVRLFLDTDAAPLAARDIVDAGDPRYAAVGLPTLSQLIGEALDAGVLLSVCQAGMALAGLDARAIDPRIEPGGMISLLARLDDDRLVTC